MPSKRQRRLEAIQQIADDQGWKAIDCSEWAHLIKTFPEVSESTLRHDLREISIAVAPLIEGVRLDSIDELHRTLLALADTYEELLLDAPGQTWNPARKLVLDARRKAEQVLRNPKVAGDKRVEMEEKFLGIRTWLENPCVFAAWSRLRVQLLGNRERPVEHQ